jgi:hypothetical protein
MHDGKSKKANHIDIHIFCNGHSRLSETFTYRLAVSCIRAGESIHHAVSFFALSKAGSQLELLRYNSGGTHGADYIWLPCT